MLTKPRVLLADDQFEIARIYADTLEANGYEADIASDGHEALNLLYSKRYDIVVTDLIMPPGSSGGLWLVTAIRRVSKLPIVILSGKGTVPQAVEAMKVGANDYVVKEDLIENDLQSFIDCINDLLNDDQRQSFGIDLRGNWVGYEEGIRIVEIKLRELCAKRLGDKTREQVQRIIDAEPFSRILKRIDSQTNGIELLRELTFGQLTQVLTDGRAYSYWNDIFTQKADLQLRLQRIVEMRNQLAHNKGNLNLIDLKQVEVDVNLILEQIQKSK